MSDSKDVLDFAQAAERRKHEKRDEKVADIRDQFDRALLSMSRPVSKPTPVKDFLRKKKAKKKR